MTRHRIEVMGRSIDLDVGVQARIGDPMWMLGRQWQVGEFRGDNASQPVSVSLEVEEVPLSSFRAGQGADPLSLLPDKDRPPRPPIEALSEATGQTRNGFSGMSSAVRSGQALLRAFTAAGYLKLVEILKAEYGFGRRDWPLAGAGRSRAALSMIQARGIDGRRLYDGLSGPLLKAIKDMPHDAAQDAEAIFARWLLAYAPPEDTAWDAGRLEYGFSLSGLSADGEVVLDANAHRGGHLDWYQFDIGGDPHGLKEPHPDYQKSRTRSAFPTPVRYAGMPAARWWEIEDNSVHMGDINSGPGDFARLMVAEFATSYSDDWFVVPLRLPRGSLCRVTSIHVFDNFETKPIPVAHVSRHDWRDDPNDPDERIRSFRLFELSGDPGPKANKAPWLFLPETLATSMEGTAIETVELMRDEGANLAWAVERVIEGPLGRAFERGAEWFSSDLGNALAPVSLRPAGAGEPDWSFHLSTDLPPVWWIPFLPERTEDGGQIQLRRGQMQGWAEHAADVAGTRGSFLGDPGTPFYIPEEEIPRSGVTLTRRWQFARGPDGRHHLWLQNRHGPGRQERSSGLRWDVIHRRS